MVADKLSVVNIPSFLDDERYTRFVDFRVNHPRKIGNEIRASDMKDAFWSYLQETFTALGPGSPSADVLRRNLDQLPESKAALQWATVVFDLAASLGFPYLTNYVMRSRPGIRSEINKERPNLLNPLVLMELAEGICFWTTSQFDLKEKLVASRSGVWDINPRLKDDFVSGFIPIQDIFGNRSPLNIGITNSRGEKGLPYIPPDYAMLEIYSGLKLGPRYYDGTPVETQISLLSHIVQSREQIIFGESVHHSRLTSEWFQNNSHIDTDDLAQCALELERRHIYFD